MKIPVFIAICLIPIFIVPSFAEPVHEIVILPKQCEQGCEENDECFSPSTLYIHVGDRVEFIKKHQCSVSLNLGSRDTGVDNSMYLHQSFLESGVYPYFDMVHPWASGRIVVGEPSSPTQNVDESLELAKKQQDEIDDASNQAKILRLEEHIDEWKEIAQKKDREVATLEFQNEKLVEENDVLKTTIYDLEKKIEDLNAVIMEQIKVIMEWITNR